MLVRPMLLHLMALVSVRLFCKNLHFGQLARIFWANGLPPPLTKNCPYAYVCATFLLLTFLICPNRQWARDHENWTLRIPPVRNAHVYRCDSAEYQDELVCTNSQTDYTYALDNAWAGSKSQANTTRGSSFITSNSS